ncbi:MAG: S8 family peptidase [Planctomycetaceae bacterium]
MVQKLLVWMTWGVLVSGFGSAFAWAAEKPEMRRIAVSFKAEKVVGVAGQKPSKLAPELRALLLVEGQLVGSTAKGEAVIETQRKHAESLFSKSDDIGLTVSSEPDDFVPIKRLVLSYDKDNKPSKESLKKAGLKVIEGGDYEKGTFLIVEPIEKTGITSKTVTALDANEEVTKAYPSRRVKLPPQPSKDPPKEAEAEAEAETPTEKKIEKPAKKIKTSQTTAKLLSSVTPNDPRFGQLWGIRQINAPVAWTTVVSSPVIVAVIDTGIDYNHPDLKQNLWTAPNGTHGFNAITGSEYPLDDNGHGTHCAGTIGAVGNNDFGVAGVNWDVKIMGLKFLDREGSGDDFDAIRCIDFAIDHGAKVLSNSWGSYGEAPELEEAIERANDKGVLFIAAASNDNVNNDGPRPSFPSSYKTPNIIAVMSVDPNGGKSWFSNYGRTSVDLAAPGSDILSTIPGGGFGPKNGTSMATPHVAGAAALLWGHPKYKQAQASDIKKALLANVSKQPGLANRCLTGGILDLQFMGGGLPPDPTKPGTPPAAGAVLLASEKFVKPIQVTDGDNVLKVHIDLVEECDVLIRADSSVTAEANVRTVSTGFLNDEDIERRWQGSARRMTVRAKSWTPVVSSFVVRLGSGSHDLYWKVWDEDSTGNTLTLNAGTMTVEAIPLRKK